MKTYGFIRLKFCYIEYEYLIKGSALVLAKKKQQEFLPVINFKHLKVHS